MSKENQNIEINDKREIIEFKKNTFSNFKKTDAKKQLINNVLQCKLEEANYWCAEFICAGLFLDLWEIIIFIFSKHIHLGNPKLPAYIELRFQQFKKIIFSTLTNELELRNNKQVRNIFCEIISILCFSRKKNKYEQIKIKDIDYDLNELSYRLKANSLNNCQNTFLSGDAKELFIACNELAYCIQLKNQKNDLALYWIEWILGFEQRCKKKKEVCVCERRIDYVDEPKLQKDVVWLIWDILKNEAKIRNNQTLYRLINSLSKIYCIHFSLGVKRKRRFLFYFSISLLTEAFNANIKLYDSNEHDINIILSKLDKIYGEIKKNEIKPDTDYLFHGIKEKSNKEKTMEKLKIMNKNNLF